MNDLISLRLQQHNEGTQANFDVYSAGDFPNNGNVVNTELVSPAALLPIKSIQ